MSGALHIDLTAGVVQKTLSTTTGLAWGLFVFCFVVSLAVEAFGRSPTQPKDLGGAAFRAVVVLVLLTFYPKLFGSLFGLAEGIAARVAPQDVWDNFTAAQQAWLKANAPKTATVGAFAGAVPGWVSGYFFDSLVALALLLGQASLWVVNVFGRVLAVLLYVVGPLALVFSVVRGVDSGSRWFRVFVSVLCWPSLSGLLVSLTVAFGLQASGGTSGSAAAFEAVAVAALMAVMSFAVPLVASSLVGSSFGALSSGWASVTAWGAPVASVGATALGHAGEVWDRMRGHGESAASPKSLPPSREE